MGRREIVAGLVGAALLQTFPHPNSKCFVTEKAGVVGSTAKMGHTCCSKLFVPKHVDAVLKE